MAHLKRLDYDTSVQDLSDSFSALLKSPTCKVTSDLNFTNYGKSLSEMWQRYIFDFISQHHVWVNTKLTDFPQYRSSLLSNILVLLLFTSVGYHTLNWHVWFPQYVCGFSCNNQLLEIWSLSVASNITRDAREDGNATCLEFNTSNPQCSSGNGITLILLSSSCPVCNI